MQGGRDDDDDTPTPKRVIRQLKPHLADLALRYSSAATQLEEAAKLYRQAADSIVEAGADLSRVGAATRKTYLAALELYIKDLSDSGYDVAHAVREMHQEED